MNFKKEKEPSCSWESVKTETNAIQGYNFLREFIFWFKTWIMCLAQDRQKCVLNKWQELENVLHN